MVYISQDLNDPLDDGTEVIEHCLDHVEDLLGQIAQRHEVCLSQVAQASEEVNSPEATETIPYEIPPIVPEATQSLSTQTSQVAARFEDGFATAMRDNLSAARSSLSGYLNSLLPVPAVASLIVVNGRSPFEWMWPPESSLHTGRLSALAAQPVIFARKLIQLALCLEHQDIGSFDIPNLCPGEPLSHTAQRFLSIAEHVTSQDLLVDSVDGLEALMLEALYQVHLGNAEDASLIFRRGLSIAESMGLLNAAAVSDERTKSVVFRFIYADRFTSLYRGSPYAVDDSSFMRTYVLEADTPASKLERIQIVIAGHIITRNIRMQHMGIQGQVYEKDTLIIDRMLKQSIRSLPTVWWAPPSAAGLTEEEATEATGRLTTQMHQYYLVLLSQQPYFLQDCISQRQIPMAALRRAKCSTAV